MIPPPPPTLSRDVSGGPAPSSWALNKKRLKSERTTAQRPASPWLKATERLGLLVTQRYYGKS